MTLVWGQASDPETLPAGLTYNLRVGSTPGGSELVAPMSLADGFHQIAEKGNVQHNRLWTIENIDSSKTYYWSVQTVDNSFLGSAFAPEQIVQPKLIIDSSFVEVNFGLQALAASDAEWGDIDGDGDLDFAITGGAANQGFTHIYRNDNIAGLRSFTQTGGNLLAVHSGALAWADFDNDNDLGLLVTGLNNSLDAQTGLFRNDSGAFSPINATLPNVTASSADWADVDHDGDLDLLLTGSASTGFISEIYENRSRNGLFLGMQAGLTGLAQGDALFFDFNNDQDLEVLITDVTENDFRTTLLYEFIDATGEYQNVNPSIPVLQNYPNPFNPGTTISYELAKAAHVVMKIYDVLGREVATLVDQPQPAGRFRVIFETSRLATGVYFYRLVAGGFSQTRKMLLVR